MMEDDTLKFNVLELNLLGSEITSWIHTSGIENRILYLLLCGYFYTRSSMNTSISKSGIAYNLCHVTTKIVYVYAKTKK